MCAEQSKQPEHLAVPPVGPGNSAGEQAMAPAALDGIVDREIAVRVSALGVGADLQEQADDVGIVATNGIMEGSITVDIYHIDAMRGPHAEQGDEVDESPARGVGQRRRAVQAAGVRVVTHVLANERTNERVRASQGVRAHVGRVQYPPVAAGPPPPDRAGMQRAGPSLQPRPDGRSGGASAI